MSADPCETLSANQQVNRVATLLKGNNDLRNEDRAYLRTFLDAAQGDLVERDEKMKPLAKGASALLHEEHDNRIQEAHSPVYALSDDVLYEIFTHCFPAWPDLERKLLDELGSEDSSLNSKNAPWTLSYVCSQWRHVALSAPLLWSTIIFNFPAVPGKLSSFCYNLDLFMSRSGNSDLSIALSIVEDDVIPDVIFAHLSLSVTRWRRLCLRADRNPFPFALSEFSFERLEEVILHDIQESRGADGKLLAPFQDAPQLRRMYLPDKGYITLPWSQITHYERKIYRNPWTLRAMPNLTHLTLTVADPRARVDPLLPKLSFPKLVSLSLALRTHSFFSSLFPHLDMPALTEFRVSYLLGIFKSWERSSFVFRLPTTDVFPRQLKSLHIACDVPDFIDQDNWDLVSWLRLATDVTAFSLHLPSIPLMIVFELLVHEVDEDEELRRLDQQFPHLRSLELWATAKDAQMPTGMILEVLKSRSGSMQQVSRLKEFCTNVDASRFSEGRVERWMDVCKKIKVICPR